MWAKEISDIILDYYSTYYASRERAYYEIQIGNCVVGGIRGLKLLLGETPLPTDPYELYSIDIIKDAREIADEFFIRTCNNLTRVNTRVPWREVWIDVANRLAAVVYSESTTQSSFKEITVNEIEKQNQAVFSVNIDKREEFELTRKTGKYKVMGPSLYIIDILKKIYDPLAQDEKEENRALITRLIPLVDAKYWGENYSSIESELKNARNVCADLLKGRIFIGYRGNQIILISDKITDEELSERSAIYDMRLPNEYYLRKVVIKRKGVRINIYTNGFHEIIPTSNKCGLESVRARFFMIEDNTAVSMVDKGILKYANPLVTRTDLEKALTEEYPTADTYEDGLKLFQENFYGIYRNPISMKKLYVKEFDRIGPYFPVMTHKCETQE